MSESESSPTKAAPAAPVAADDVLCMVELDTVAESELDSELSEAESDESLDDDAAPA